MNPVPLMLVFGSAAAWATIGLVACHREGPPPIKAVERPAITKADGGLVSVYTDPETGCEYLMVPYGITPRLHGVRGNAVRGCQP